jgi:hypothetical protein
MPSTAQPPHPASPSILLALAFGQPRVGVDDGVFLGRHFAVTISSLMSSSRFAARIGFAGGQSERFSASRPSFTSLTTSHDIGATRLYHGHRFVRMTIVTRRVQHRGDLRRRRIIAARRQRRVGARRICDLQQGEHHDERAENPFQFLLHSNERTRKRW